MLSRQNLQTKFEEILGSRNVYFQPPESLKLQYPAIVYSRREIENTFANNMVYMQAHCYEVTVIDRNPESEIVDKISLLSHCRFDRHFVSDNLYHDVFILYNLKGGLTYETDMGQNW